MKIYHSSDVLFEKFDESYIRNNVGFHFSNDITQVLGSKKYIYECEVCDFIVYLGVPSNYIQTLKDLNLELCDQTYEILEKVTNVNQFFNVLSGELSRDKIYEIFGKLNIVTNIGGVHEYIIMNTEDITIKCVHFNIQ